MFTKTQKKITFLYSRNGRLLCATNEQDMRTGEEYAWNSANLDTTINVSNHIEFTNRNHF
jgi:hypothetical protein